MRARFAKGQFNTPDYLSSIAELEPEETPALAYDVDRLVDLDQRAAFLEAKMARFMGTETDAARSSAAFNGIACRE